jgi:hypothetical protein
VTTQTEPVDPAIMAAIMRRVEQLQAIVAEQRGTPDLELETA